MIQEFSWSILLNQNQIQLNKWAILINVKKNFIKPKIPLYGLVK